MMRPLANRRTLGSLALLVLGLASARAGAQLPINELRGVVVSKADGKPLAGVPVVIAHAEKGSITIQNGQISAQGQDVASEELATRNFRLACDALSDADGSFVLRNYSAPTEHWMLAAGNRGVGLALTQSITPSDYNGRQLKIEVEPAAYIQFATLADPTDGETRSQVQLSLIDFGPVAKPATSHFDCDAPESHVQVYAWSNPEAKVARLGPLPAGFTYRVTHSLWSPKLRYDITLFSCTVHLQSGVTTEISLTPAAGQSLAGRITDKRGQPLSNVNVVLHTGGEASVDIGTLSDSDGYYTLANIPTGRHVVELHRHITPNAPT